MESTVRKPMIFLVVFRNINTGQKESVNYCLAIQLKRVYLKRITINADLSLLSVVKWIVKRKRLQLIVL